ncbi:FtsX-like permease family protein [Streptomyces sp. NPDC058045]|uniref:FtsX-like permease family protein n=1 Tax=Streptomyces sp. NPDC058045 TaxID=3346311 RepID=UPI0036EFE5EE
MREFALGLRMMAGSGRGLRIRLALMALGTSLAVCCLAMVLAVPTILQAHDDRVAAREPQSLEPGTAGAENAPVVLTRRDPHGWRMFTRVFVAPATAGARPAPAPPGLDRLPAPGEVFVSPAVRRQLRSEPALKELLPGREKGVIGGEGLGGPDELLAYVGIERSAVPRGPAYDGEEARPVEGFGLRYPPSPVVEPATLRILRLTLAGVVLLPLTVFLTVCARLSARERMRRLAALRLLGLSARGVQRVNAAESVTAALAGALLGLAEYWLINQVLARTGLPDFRWYADDGQLSAGTVLLSVLGAPALAWLAARNGARKAVADPLGARRGAATRRPARWSLLPLFAGLGIVTGYCIAGMPHREIASTPLNDRLMPIGILLTGVGLVWSLPYLSHVLSKKGAPATRSVALHLALRRNEVDPGSAIRVVSGLVLLIYAASLTQGVLIEEQQVARQNPIEQEYRIGMSDLGPGERSRLAALPGVRSHGMTLQSGTLSPATGEDTNGPRLTALVATCAQLAKMVQHFEGCVDGRVLRLRDPERTAVNPPPGPKQSISFWRSEVDGPTNTRWLAVRPTAGTVTVHSHQLSAPAEATLLIPPGMIPEGTFPGSAKYVLTGGAATDEVRRVLDGIGSVAPAADVRPVGVVVESLQQIAVVESLLGVGMVMGLVIGVAAFVVSVVDRAVERRAHVTALSLLGARAGTLRAAQCAQVVVPLAVGLVPALVAGKLAESSYLVTGGGAVFWDWEGIPVLASAAVGVLVLTVLAALPLVGRRIDPELIRRD